MVDIRRKDILIRADGNAKIGAGHLMRCLTIAEVLDNKVQVGFICADRDSAELALSKGFDAYVLGTDYQDMEQELPLWSQLFGEGKQSGQEEAGQEEIRQQEQYVRTRKILVDSYYVTNAYLEVLQAYGQVILLDDMCKHPRNVNALINYNAFATKEMYDSLNSPYETRYYVGGKYIPIRKEFCEKEYQVKEQVENILITTGGGDSENIAGRILDKIWDASHAFHVVTGRFNPHYEEMMKRAEDSGNIHVYHDVKDMAGLMHRCDLAVTAGGTTIYELSALGVPFVCFSYAENQEKLTEYIGTMQIAGYSGAYHKNAAETLEDIAKQIEELKKSSVLRKEYSEKERQLVDGEGARRIAGILQNVAE